MSYLRLIQMFGSFLDDRPNNLIHLGKKSNKSALFGDGTTKSQYKTSKCGLRGRQTSALEGSGPDLAGGGVSPRRGAVIEFSRGR